jgi:hypothetical protein
MEKIDPHRTHHYSHEQIIMTAYTLDLHNVKTNPKYDNVREILENFMNERVKEIKDRWK